VQRAIEMRQSVSAAPTIKTKRSPTRRGGGAMAKNPTHFAQQNTERAVQATNYGMNWMREIAEQNLTQGKAALESWLMITRKAMDGVDHQASVIRGHSMGLVEETLSNTLEFAQKLVQLQSEFVGRQAQVFGDQTKELGQSIMQGANELANTTFEGAAEASRSRSEAA
jgi:hypothetical protein